MRHIADGVLRRLEDEPLSVPDRVAEHVARCGRCGARRALIAGDREHATRLLSSPQLVPDVDAAWSRFERGLNRSPQARTDRRLASLSGFARPLSFPSLSLRTGLVVGTVAIVVAGTAAAASLTTIFAPTHVAPVSLSQSDLSAIATFIGLGDNQVIGGFRSPTGSSTLPFGTIKWSSSGEAQQVSSLAAATAAAGFPLSLPANLPAGVGAVHGFVVQPQVTATVSFDATAPGIGGSSVTLHAGPAVLTEYGGAGGTDVPTMAVATMRRPTATSTGATMSQIEAFLLSRPGIQPALAEEVRLLGDLGTTLPVPVPAGAAVRSVQVGNWPGVLLADRSNAAAVVVWEDGSGMLHTVAGILDSQDVLSVADQLR
jgi:hypothetical protein